MAEAPATFARARVIRAILALGLVPEDTEQVIIDPVAVRVITTNRDEAGERAGQHYSTSEIVDPDPVEGEDG